MIDFDAPMDALAGIAARLGWNVVSWLGQGGDGFVGMLPNGHVLKLSFQDEEAAASLAILAGQHAGLRHPCMPAIHSIHMVQSRFGETGFAIVRDAVSLCTLEKVRGMAALLQDLDLALAEDGLAGLHDFVNSYLQEPGEMQVGDLLADIRDQITFTYVELGILPCDIHVKNIGILPNGRFCLFDFSKCDILPPWAVEQVRSGGVPFLDDPEMAHSHSFGHISG